jgi:peptide deformylase
LAIRPVLRYPDPILKAPAEPIAPGTDALLLAEDLVETMRASPACVGLAAPQIGVSVRAFCLDVSEHKKARTNHGLVVLLNPIVVSAEGSEIIREGCMSVPDFTANVRRSSTIVVEGTTPEGETRTIEAEGFEARAFQHEIDHLDGLLYLDRVASLSTDLFRRKRYAR